MDNTTTPPGDLTGAELEEYLEENAPAVDPNELEETGYMMPDAGATLPLYSHINANLRKPVRDRHILWLPGRKFTDRNTGEQRTGEPVPYIPWNTCADYLDHFALGWHYLIVSRTVEGGLCIVHARLLIPHAHGVTPRDALGEIAVGAQGYGTEGERAESKALRRAAAKHGLGRHLYSKTGRPQPPAHMRAGQQVQVQARQQARQRPQKEQVDDRSAIPVEVRRERYTQRG